MGVSRRNLLLGTAAVFGAACAAGCQSKDFTCTDTRGLAEGDLTARAATAYTDHAADPARTCDSCSQYVGTDDTCGTCKLVRGPIHPKGTCKVFSSKG